jgi:hypothetical protein
MAKFSVKKGSLSSGFNLGKAGTGLLVVPALSVLVAVLVAVSLQENRMKTIHHKT